jgi:GNAT superfamily N-acetyltransferase
LRTDGTLPPTEINDEPGNPAAHPADIPMKRTVGTPIDIRPYRELDEPAVLELLKVALGPGPVGWRTPEFFRWKHEANPFGASFMLVAEADGRIVGLRAFMRWRFVAGDRVVRAVRAVDTATHPDFQRMGIFSRLTKQALEGLRGETDLVFNTPNSRSGPGYLKLGWDRVGRATVSAHVRRPIRFIRRLRSAHRRAESAPRLPIPVNVEPAWESLADVDALSALLDEASLPAGRLATPRNPDFLKWRYGEAPLLDYRAVRERRGGHLEGLAIFRVRPRGTLWECSIADVIVREGDPRTTGRLLRRAAAAAPVDYVAIRLPSRWAAAEAATRSGYFPTPVGPTLVVNPISEGILPDPRKRRSWALSLGDLEVF